jgi:UDP-N-acetylmuramoyl-tripeptide--D-alanyl-D-alanine ligase
MSFRGKASYQCIVLEYGIDRPKEMEFLINIAKPDIGVFTAIDAVHSEQFGNPAEIAKEEVKMIQNTKEIAFLNANDTYAQQLKDMISIDKISYQTQGHELTADIHHTKETFHEKNGKIEVTFDLSLRDHEHHIHTNLLGKPNYGYIGVALAITEIMARKTQKKENVLSKELHVDYQLQPGRMSIFSGVEKSIIIDGTYNSSPLSVRKLIDAVHNMKVQVFPQRKVWLVLGDMRELGDLTEREHRLLATYVSQIADKVFLVGQHMHNYLADELPKVGYPAEQIFTFGSAIKAGETLQTMLQEPGLECVVVCKGSQNTIFLEETVKLLLKDPQDQRLLTRQSHRWLAKKKEFFAQS